MDYKTGCLVCGKQAVSVLKLCGNFLASPATLATVDIVESVTYRFH